MRDKEKLAKALETLHIIANSPWLSATDIREYAANVIAELTEPRMETVEVCQWATVLRETGGITGNYYDEESALADKTDGEEVVKMVATFSLPIKEKEEVVIIGKAIESLGKGYCIITGVPLDWVGNLVEVRLKGE